MATEPTTPDEPPLEMFGLVHGQETLIAKLRNMPPELLSQIRATTPSPTTGAP